MKYYVLVDIDKALAEVYELKNGKYDKVINAKNEKVNFNLDNCKIEFDFSKIWFVKKLKN